MYSCTHAHTVKIQNNQGSSFLLKNDCLWWVLQLPFGCSGVSLCHVLEHIVHTVVALLSVWCTHPYFWDKILDHTLLLLITWTSYKLHPIKAGRNASILHQHSILVVKCVWFLRNTRNTRTTMSRKCLVKFTTLGIILQLCYTCTCTLYTGFVVYGVPIWTVLIVSQGKALVTLTSFWYRLYRALRYRMCVPSWHCSPYCGNTTQQYNHTSKAKSNCTHLKH